MKELNIPGIPYRGRFPPNHNSAGEHIQIRARLEGRPSMVAACRPFRAQRACLDGGHCEQRASESHHPVCCGLQGRRRTAPPHEACLGIVSTPRKLPMPAEGVQLYELVNRSIYEHTWNIVDASIDKFRCHCEVLSGEGNSSGVRSTVVELGILGRFHSRT